MREFRQYIGEEVKETRPNLRLATATWKAANERLGYAERTAAREPPKYAVENAFEAIREAIDALLFLKGYKSYSHEASVQYLAELAFSPNAITAVDNLRRQRNGIKYYGDDATDDEAKKALIIAKETLQKLGKHAKDLKTARGSS